MTVSIERVTKLFGRTPAVHDCSFEAVPGRLTALLGPSGSGKTTVLRCIAGLESVDRGTIRIGDRDVTDLPPQARNLGMVFQSYALFGHLDVIGNIAYGLRVRGVGERQVAERVGQLLELVQLKDYGRRMPAQLSGGQRQRVALARALAPKPSLLLLDEPFSALDARVRRELQEFTRRLHEELRVTTLLVTHDQDEAMELADRLVVMNEGRIEQIGTPAEVYDAPATEFIARFIGSANVIQRPGPDGVARSEFVRPHDIGLSPARSDHESDPDVDGTQSAAVAFRRATVERVVRVGGWVKVTVVLRDGQRMVCNMARGAFDDLGVREGDLVTVDLGKSRLYVPDYAI